MKTGLSTTFLLVCLMRVVTSFYLPGLASVTYCTDEKNDNCKNKLMVYVNRLNTVDSIVPYEYHDFDFCIPADDLDKSPTENLGQVVFGERIRPSAYNLIFNKDEVCKLSCAKTYSPDDKDAIEKLAFLKSGINLNYQHHWIVDNMPVTWCYKVESGDEYCSLGFPIGCYVTKDGVRKNTCNIRSEFKVPDTYYLFNHFDIAVEYHPLSDEDWGGRKHGGIGGHIVSAKISLQSIDHQKDGEDGCENAPVLGIPGGKLEKQLNFKYTYSVTWRENRNVKWASRWDYILDSMPHTNVQWFSIMNSLVVVAFLSGAVAAIMFKILHKDIACYNRMDSLEDAKEEFGWKALHGDVFRAPRDGMMLSIFIGSGTQLFFMSLITLVLACFGFLSPANRGALMTCVLVLYVCFGLPAGYTSSRIYKTFGGEKWKTNVILTAFFCPGVVFGIFFILNLVLWAKQSSAAIPFSTLVALLALWIGVSAPLTFVGAYFGFRKKPIEHPECTNQIPRQIPRRSLFTRPLTSMILGGILPFGCIFIQLFFILNSIWFHQVYYMFGFLFLVFVVLIITCSEVTISLCYFHLCAEDYNWWWRSFLTSGFTAVYVFFYCIHFFVIKLEMSGFTNTFLYFGYTIILVFLFFLLTGTIGFFACFWFVSKIYSVAKVKRESEKPQLEKEVQTKIENSEQNSTEEPQVEKLLPITEQNSTEQPQSEKLLPTTIRNPEQNSTEEPQVEKLLPITEQNSTEQPQPEKLLPTTIRNPEQISTEEPQAEKLQPISIRNSEQNSTEEPQSGKLLPITIRNLMTFDDSHQLTTGSD